MKKTFYSNGKLLITGEYVVLDGAIALALPTKFGQNLILDEVNSDKNIQWKSFDNDGNCWFETRISFSSIIGKEFFGAENNIKNTLIEILHEAYVLNPDFLAKSNGFLITTQLTFPRNWGLGTSSTLINNIAQWTNVDAFELLKNSFGGSGYDIACAQNNFPVLYQLKNGKSIVEKVDFDPSFQENIYFVYLNKKQNSKSAISNYRNKQIDKEKFIPEVNAITQNILKAIDYKTFANALEKHEIVLSKILEMQTVKEALFDDFTGTIKSLGAWGGDFVIVACEENPSSYFEEKGYETIVPYRDMIL